jgi:hypothetical protein
MKYLFLILNSIVCIVCNAQNNTSGIKAKICFIAVQYNGCDKPNCLADEKGIIISLFNYSNEDYYVEDGTDIGDNLYFSQNNVYKKLSYPDDSVKGMAPDMAPSHFDFIMSNGNGLNSHLNKPDDLYDYTRSLIVNKLKDTHMGGGYAMRKSAGIIYLKSKSTYSVFFNLTRFNLKGKYKVSLKRNNTTAPFADINLILPDKVKEYKKFTGTITSDVLEIYIPPR